MYWGIRFLCSKIRCPCYHAVSPFAARWFPGAAFCSRGSHGPVLCRRGCPSRPLSLTCTPFSCRIFRCPSLGDTLPAAVAVTKCPGLGSCGNNLSPHRPGGRKSEAKAPAGLVAAAASCGLLCAHTPAAPRVPTSLFPQVGFHSNGLTECHLPPGSRDAPARVPRGPEEEGLSSGTEAPYLVPAVQGRPQASSSALNCVPSEIPCGVPREPQTSSSLLCGGVGFNLPSTSTWRVPEPSSPGGGGAQVCVQGALSMQEVTQKTLI